MQFEVFCKSKRFFLHQYSQQNQNLSTEETHIRIQYILIGDSNAVKGSQTQVKSDWNLSFGDQNKIRWRQKLSNNRSLQHESRLINQNQRLIEYGKWKQYCCSRQQKIVLSDTNTTMISDLNTAVGDLLGSSDTIKGKRKNFGRKPNKIQVSKDLLTKCYNIPYNKDLNKREKCSQQLIKLQWAFDGLIKQGTPVFHEILASLLREDVPKMSKKQLLHLSMPSNTQIRDRLIYSLMLFKNLDVFLLSSLSSKKLRFCLHILYVLSLSNWAKKYKGEYTNSHKKYQMIYFNWIYGISDRLTKQLLNSFLLLLNCIFKILSLQLILSGIQVQWMKVFYSCSKVIAKQQINGHQTSP